MELSRPLISLFSQSGKEILDIATFRGKLPDLIITNNQNVEQIIEPLVELVEFLPNRPTSDQYRELFNRFENPIITLHGWLRIIPADICEEFEIYNGHPGLVHLFPELKGFNQQEVVAGKQEEYPTIGSVIHKVTPELDGGAIVNAVLTENTTKTIEDAYTTLRVTSLESWKEFFNEKLYEQE